MMSRVSLIWCGSLGLRLFSFSSTIFWCSEKCNLLVGFIGFFLCK